MNKKTIIYVAIGLISILIIALAIYFTIQLTSNKTNKEYKTKKLTLDIYNDNFEVDKIIEITDKEKLKELNQICNSITSEQDDLAKNLAIRNDVKLDLNNGIIFFIQLDYKDYCFIENSNKNIKQVIVMPEGLSEYVNTILKYTI